MSNGDVREKHAQQLQKTQMCKFFASGRCGKGSDCSFAHHPSEIRQRPDLNRTSMCKAFLTRGNCTNPRCAFAHDERELRATEGFFKTKLCKFADSGRCKHGKSCRFAHTQEELHAGKPKDKPVQALPQASGSRGLTVSNLTPESSPLSPISGLSDPFFGEATLPTVQTVTVLKALQALQGQLSTLSMVQAQVQAQDRALVRMGKMDSHSDQSASTRAETNTSVAGNVGANSPDRNSSGSESGEEADYEKEPVPQQDSRMRDLTTLTIFNVPDFLTQAAFISLLEDLAPVVRNAFDFFYLPWNSNQEKNLGHAIINFFLGRLPQNLQTSAIAFHSPGRVTSRDCASCQRRCRGEQRICVTFLPSVWPITKIHDSVPMFELLQMSHSCLWTYRRNCYRKQALQHGRAYHRELTVDQ
ncbi:unnamed protein product [Cladocopium goreaui]|uniref:Protein MEI2-like 5 n=1 Tax=Cladocopium goreaui TaxID=2562237 RepID=A0A9P1GJ09_9DINO|nr:unnamed protein product [Cladocopium goreaui]